MPHLRTAPPSSQRSSAACCLFGLFAACSCVGVTVAMVQWMVVRLSMFWGVECDDVDALGRVRGGRCLRDVCEDGLRITVDDPWRVRSAARYPRCGRAHYPMPASLSPPASIRSATRHLRVSDYEHQSI